MLMSIIQISPLQNGVFATGSPCSIGADRMRTRESLVTQLMMVCGQGVFFKTQSSHHYAQHPAHGPEPDASHHKQLQGQEDQIHLALDENHPRLALQLVRTSPDLLELFFESVALRLDPGQLFVLVAVLLSS